MVSELRKRRVQGHCAAYHFRIRYITLQGLPEYSKFCITRTSTLFTQLHLTSNDAYNNSVFFYVGTLYLNLSYTYSTSTHSSYKCI